jgi:aspartate-semialdehyde dehydrogenase
MKNTISGLEFYAQYPIYLFQLTLIPNVTENLDLGPSQSPGAGRSQLARISNTGNVEIAPAARAFASDRSHLRDTLFMTNRSGGVKLAIIGATGAVGKELLLLLEKRRFPLRSLHCFASERSSGKKIHFQGEEIEIQSLAKNSFNDIDIAIFSAGSNVARKWAPIAKEHGSFVIDNSSAFRMDDNVPLLIPEVNLDALKEHHRLIACPNCSTAIMLMALAPLHRQFKIARIVAATYQAASGAGARAIQELEEETRAFLENRSYQRTVLPHPYAFNLFPHNSTFNENGYAEEELKMRYETQKILEDATIGVHATCVRVPVLRAHSETLNVTFHSEVSVESAYKILKTAPGVKILEDRAQNRFAMPLDATGQDDILCGRIRKDDSFPNTLDLWVVGDQLLKGAALNALQIAELITRKKTCISSI